MSTHSYRSTKKILLGQDNNALVILFAINALVFVLINFIKIVYYLSDIPIEFFYKQILDWFIMPATTPALFLKPWTIITHMFTHYSIWHLISTCLWLWAFGFVLQDLAGNNKLIPIYLYGGFTGAIVFVVASKFFPSSPLIGGGAAVMAVAIATTTLSPEYRIFPLVNGGIPLWVLTVVFVAIDFASLTNGNNAIIASHIAGAAMGFFFVKALQKGTDLGLWMINLVHWIDDLFSPEKKYANKKQSEKFFYQNSRKPYEKIANITQQRLDEILDKINLHGYSFLTDEEKSFLLKASGEDHD